MPTKQGLKIKEIAARLKISRNLASRLKKTGKLPKKIEEVYSIKEIAGLLKLSPLFIYQKVKQGNIKTIRVSKVKRISKEEFFKLTKEKKVEQFYKISEAAKILKIHRDHLIRLVRTKKLKAIKFGSTYRISESALCRFSRQKKLKPLLTVLEIQKSLMLCRLSVIKLIREKKISAFKIGKFYRISQELLAASTNQKKEVKFYSPKEAAKILKFNPDFINKLIREKKLLSVQIGASKRISEEALFSFLKNHALNKKKVVNKAKK